MRETVVNCRVSSSILPSDAMSAASSLREVLNRWAKTWGYGPTLHIDIEVNDRGMDAS